MLQILEQWDHEWFFLINSNHHPVFDFLFGSLTYLGHEIVLPLIVFAIILKKIPKQNLKKVLLLTIISFLVCGGISQGIKSKAKRHRPARYFYDQVKATGAVRDRGMEHVDFMRMHGVDIHIVGPRLKHRSFPSGHTTTAFSGAAILWILFGGRWVLAFLFALMVGYSRVYVSAHFPLDVIVGALIGTIFTVPIMLYGKKKLLAKTQI